MRHHSVRPTLYSASQVLSDSVGRCLLEQLDSECYRLFEFGRSGRSMVWDNATFDSCAKARKYLARWGDRIALHFSPQ